MEEGVKATTGRPPRKKRGGRPKGHGKLQKMLGKLVPGNSMSFIFGVNKNQMNSIRQCAFQFGFKITMRVLPDGNYCIWRK